MSFVPKSHPRRKSLLIREKLVYGFERGLVAKEGLLAQGRGEAFDYLLGEKTSKLAKSATRAAAAQILLAQNPVISVNGNTAALCPKELVRLGKQTRAKLEVNLFYENAKRRRKIIKTLYDNGAKKVLGLNLTARLAGIDSARSRVERDGIFSADVVIIPLEDGDRALALKKAGKTVIAFDLNPLSRTSQTADITIIDNVTRAVDLLVCESKKLAKKSPNSLDKIIANFDNKKNLAENIIQIRDNLSRRAKIA